MKVFIVAENDYEGVTIQGIFSRPELAETFSQEIGGNVEEWEIDSEVGKRRRDVWTAEIGMAAGQVRRESTWEGGAIELPTRRVGDIHVGEAWIGPNCPLVARASSFISAEHARQTAQEVRKAQLIADELGLGPSDSLHYIPANRA